MIEIKFTLSPDAEPTKIVQFIALANEIGYHGYAGQALLGTSEDDNDTDQTTDTTNGGTLPPGVEGSKTGRGRGRPRSQKASDAAAALGAAGSAAPAATAPAAAAAPEGSSNLPVGSAQLPPGIAAPPPNPTLGGASVVPFATPAGTTQLPPGIAAPAQQQQAAPSNVPPGVAMPVAQAAPAGVPGADMTLEDFKAQAMELQTMAQQRNMVAAYPFTIIRAKTWPDGTPKEWDTMVVDQVPAAERQKVLSASMNLLMS